MIQRKKITEIYNAYHDPSYLEIDPLTVVHRFKSSESLPHIALTAALLSYGRVAQIIKAIETIFARTDAVSSDFLHNHSQEEIRKILSDFKYRFHIGDDIALLLQIYKEIDDEFGSLTGFTQKLWEESKSGEKLLNRFTMAFKERGVKHSSLHRDYFNWLFPSPKDGSPCKRIVMFFRWMVRPDDGIDLGKWQFIPTSELYIPVDTHVARVGQMLGLTSKKNSSWKMAVEITENLKKLSKDDPVKYDFALCRAGMIEK